MLTDKKIILFNRSIIYMLQAQCHSAGTIVSFLFTFTRMGNIIHKKKNNKFNKNVY